MDRVSGFGPEGRRFKSYRARKNMILKLSELRGLREKTGQQKIVFTGGAFDLIHYGHIKHLRKLKKYGEVVVVALMSDARVRDLKGPGRPILIQMERAIIIDSLKFIDYVVKMPSPRNSKTVPTVKILKQLRPDIFVTSDKRWLRHIEEVSQYGVRLKIVPREKINSTTQIIRKIIRSHTDTPL